LSTTITNTNENRSRYWDGNGGGIGQEKRLLPAPQSSNASSTSSQSTKVNQVAKMFLSKEQGHILKLVKEGHSIFYTGSAGLSVSFVWCFWIWLWSGKQGQGSLSFWGKSSRLCEIVTVKPRRQLQLLHQQVGLDHTFLCADKIDCICRYCRL
jgi:hypothetical protein